MAMKDVMNRKPSEISSILKEQLNRDERKDRKAQGEQSSTYGAQPIERTERMPLVSVTLRLTPAVEDALWNAVLEHKRLGKKPSTKQGIAELAISAWLRENNFLE